MSDNEELARLMEIQAEMGAEGVREQRKKETEAVPAMLAQLRNFNQLFFYRLSILKEKIGKNDENIQLSDDDQKELTELVKQICATDAFSSQVYRSLVRDEKLGPNLRHDLDNLHVTSIVDFFVETKKEDNLHSVCGMFSLFVEVYPFYAGIIEDMLLRRQEITSGKSGHEVAEADNYGFDEQLMGAALKSFINSGAVDGRVRSFSHLEEFTPPVILENEEIKVSYGTVLNKLSNIIRNACQEEFGATQVNIKAYREGNELVYEVSDDGSGIDPEMFTIESNKFIYGSGPEKSGHNSTGSGLAFAGERIASLGAKIGVISRLKASDSTTYTGLLAEPDEKQQLRYVPLYSDNVNKEKVSTLFQIRLPITKKLI